MDKELIRKIINNLLKEVEEEEIGINLMSAHYQSGEDLRFFEPAERERVIKILKSMSEDSCRHKRMLDEMIAELTEKLRE